MRWATFVVLTFLCIALELSLRGVLELRSIGGISPSFVAPLAVFIPALMLWATIPLARDAVLANLELGLFYIVAFSVLSVLGLLMAGWGSANKYSLMGGLRATGQLIAYELPLILAVIGVVIQAERFEFSQQHADAVVDRRHHRRIGRVVLTRTRQRVKFLDRRRRLLGRRH